MTSMAQNLLDIIKNFPNTHSISIYKMRHCIKHIIGMAPVTYHVIYVKKHWPRISKH